MARDATANVRPPPAPAGGNPVSLTAILSERVVRVLVQRVSQASVVVADRTTGAIEKGLLVLVGFTHDDDRSKVVWMVDKVCGLRIFPDDEQKMNRSVIDVDGGLLVVSQFTLYGDAAKGKRPSFIDAARPEQAIPLYDGFVDLLRQRTPLVQTGEFGAHMMVSLVNDGPVTLWIER
jgi:D-aminoacyl-tRNA deacylase